jgi:pyruvate kinase
MCKPIRRTKIIATLGPASNSFDIVRKMAAAGTDVFRLNFSHGLHEEHMKNAENVRRAEIDLGTPLEIMMDLQGPKIRIGTFVDGKAILNVGSEFRFDKDIKPGDERRVHLPHPVVFDSVGPGVDILLDDGKIRMSVLKNDGAMISARIVHGGVVSDRKGVNIPNAVLPIPAVTEKDERDIELIKDIAPGMVAISFVQSAADIVYARRFIGDKIRLMAKIEKPAAVEQIDRISKEADAIMVARGDLGVEMEYESIPVTQVKVIRSAKERGRPVAIATQMLESMRCSSVPTRAEVTDVAFAVACGADYVMLSAETASGSYPVECVEVMSRIVSRIEMDGLALNLL